MTPVDYGDVCVTVDHACFTARGPAVPMTFEDLAKPEYKDMLVVQSADTDTWGVVQAVGGADCLAGVGERVRLRFDPADAARIPA